MSHSENDYLFTQKIVHIRGSSVQTSIFQSEYVYCPLVARDAQKFRVSAKSYTEKNITQ